MKIIEQSWSWIQKPVMPLETIELAGRTCYKSEDKITKDSASKFVKMLRDRKHHAMLEFGNAIVKFITNRGVTHELVRHRLCSFAQESTRYCNYGGDDIVFIKPVWWVENWREGSDLKIVNSHDLFIEAMDNAEYDYKRLLELGWRPEQAREVLPNSLKTEICVNANLREWRHIFQLRTSPQAHPQIRELMISCLNGFKQEIPVLFDDINNE